MRILGKYNNEKQQLHATEKTNMIAIILKSIHQNK